MSAKQRSSCEDVYRVHGNGKVWLLLNFHELQTEEFLDFSLLSKAMFTLYRIVKRSVTESVLDGASVHTKNAAFEAVSAQEQYCSAPLLKVERSVSDRFLKRPNQV